MSVSTLQDIDPVMALVQLDVEALNLLGDNLLVQPFLSSNFQCRYNWPQGGRFVFNSMPLRWHKNHFVSVIDVCRVSVDILAASVAAEPVAQRSLPKLD